jgi:hypothetical protein
VRSRQHAVKRAIASWGQSAKKTKTPGRQSAFRAQM